MTLAVRRYYLLKSQQAAAYGEGALAQVHLAKQQETAGEALPLSFPSRAALAAAHYTTLEDVRGADLRELVSQARLTRDEAKRVLAAID